MARLDLRGPVALDTNCLIYLLEQQGTPASQAVESVVRDAFGHGLVLSTLTITELLTGALRFGGADATAILAAVIQELPGSRILPLDLTIAERTARLRVETGLKLADAVVVATAIVASADVLLTNDRQVARVAVPPLRLVHLSDVAT